MPTFGVLEFCQHVDPTTGRRCVAAFAHAGEHDLQPASAASVQAIARRETALKRAGHVDGPVTPEKLDQAIVEATAAPSASSGSEQVGA